MILALGGHDRERMADLLCPPEAPPPQRDARNLTGPDGTARVGLDSQTYILRITWAGKLILTK